MKAPVRKLPQAVSRILLPLSVLSFAAMPAAAGTITGQVSDNTGTRALAGAEIEIRELGRSTVSGSDGSFRFTDVDAGRYTLVARYVGTEPALQEVEVGPVSTVRADIGLGSATDAVIVIGQRALMASSLSRQRASDTIESVLTRDAIGQFPDQNAAEALRRAPGVNVLNDQGEGRFVAVRGLNPELNSVSINGARVPAPESDVRFVALDVLPVELIESIEIKKSLTPDMDADTIGGSIEINTTSALDRREPYLGFAIESAYNDLSGESSPKASLDFSREIGGVFGIAGGVSFYERRFSTDNIEPDDWEEAGTGGFFAEEVQYRDYDVERKRLGASLSFDFRPTDQATLYARVLHSEFDDQESRARLTFAFDEEPYATDTEARTARFSSDDGEIAIERDLKDRFEAQKISSVVIGGDVYAGNWNIDLSGSFSAAEEKEDGSLDPTVFERVFEEPGEIDLIFNYSRLNRPFFSVNAGSAEFLDPAEYEFKEIERTTLSDAEDDEAAFELNVAREIGLERGVVDVKFGGKGRFRRKTYNKTVDFFEGLDITLADVQGRASYGLFPIDPVPALVPIRELFAANLDQLERQPFDSSFDSAVEDYRVDEDIVAAYISAGYERGPMRLVGGVRYEKTENSMRGNVVRAFEEGSTYNGAVLGADTAITSTVLQDRDYDDLFPSLNLRYELTGDLILRAGYYESLSRPSIGYLAPRFEVESDGDELEGTFGNPALEPYQASNFDLSAEWYFADNAVLQGGVFLKDVENFIVVAEFEDITVNGVTADEAEMPVNGQEATVRGLELNYQHALTGLSGPWNGLLFGVNYTYTDTEGTVNDRVIPLPAASENVLNAVVGYERNNWSLRLAVNYRDGYLDEIAFTGSGDEDRYVKPLTQYDLSARYNFSENFQLFLDLINLGDAPYVAYQNPVGSYDRLLQYEEYSWTGKLGLRVSF